MNDSAPIGIIDSRVIVINNFLVGWGANGIIAFVAAVGVANKVSTFFLRAPKS
jgi:hypothetical protein